MYPLIGTLSPLGWSELVCGFALLAAYACRLRFPSPGFAGALLTSLLFFGMTTGLTLVVVLHLRLALGRSTLDAGLTLLPWSLGLGGASLVAGSGLIPRCGAARLLRPGLALLVVGLLGCLVLPLPLSLAVVGLGGGLFTTSFFTAALQPVRPEDNGVAAGQLNAVQQLGATLGLATMGRAYLHTNHLTAPVLLAIGVVLVLMLFRVGSRLPSDVS